MGKDEIFLEKMKQQQKMGQLHGENGERQEVILNNGEDVQYRTIKINNEKEIYDVRQNLDNLNKKEEQIEQNQKEKQDFLVKNQAREKEEEAQRLEQQKMEEEYRKSTFKRVKDIYKRNSFFTKLMNICNGKAPNWKKVSQYTQEELNFLIDISAGNTLYPQQNADTRRQNYENRGFSDTEIRRISNDRNMADFSHALNERSYLSDRMDLEEKGRSR